MHKYRVLLHGQNLYASLEGRLERLGFYTTRVVEANTPAQAMLLAQKIIKEDPKLKEVMVNDTNNPPKFSIEELEKIDGPGDQSAKTGFAFYVDNDS